MRINYADALVELLNRELKDNKHTLDEFIDAYRLHNEDIILVTLSKDMKYNPETSIEKEVKDIFHFFFVV